MFANSTAMATVNTNQQMISIGTEETVQPQNNLEDLGVVFNSSIQQTIIESENDDTIVTPNSGITVLEDRWAITPYEYATNYWVTYTPYLAANNYQCATEVKNTITTALDVSVQLGFSGDAKLTKSEALSFGLSVSPSVTGSASVSFSSEMVIPAYTAKGVRAFVQWTEHLYQGCRYRRWIAVGSLEPYKESYTWEYASDKSLRYAGVKYWEVYNSSYSPTASMPAPPTGWDG